MSRLFGFSFVTIVLLILPMFVQGRVQRQFEVVSLKPAGQLTPDIILGLRADGAQVHVSWASIKDFMLIAYRLKRYQISGPSSPNGYRISWIGPSSTIRD